MSTSSEAGRGTVRVRALATLAAVVVAILVWVLADSVFGVELRTPDGPGSSETSELTLPTAAVAAGVVALLGWGLLALLERRSARARTLWTRVAVGVLVLSLFAPLFAQGLSAGNRVSLVLLHLGVGAVVIPAFRLGARTS
ncbi:DUF6069 family protein [Streptomyces cinerochromogenes]|uniref:DUF6069 family protein n=1 Tax=Streptomyces cinerochromogenes TaxID=66422 RepID=UPI0016710E57|nr:DUF6069 family protein [Streptomyces cinerochromogenes]GGS91653.1 hypothetical protein GCM10010206_63050 [Streptomyces cinerochromogenes]